MRISDCLSVINKYHTNKTPKIQDLINKYLPQVQDAK